MSILLFIKQTNTNEFTYFTNTNIHILTSIQPSPRPKVMAHTRITNKNNRRRFFESFIHKGRRRRRGGGGRGGEGGADRGIDIFWFEEEGIDPSDMVCCDSKKLQS